jgi:hypothetical protein
MIVLFATSTGAFLFVSTRAAPQKLIPWLLSAMSNRNSHFGTPLFAGNPLLFVLYLLANLRSVSEPHCQSRFPFVLSTLRVTPVLILAQLLYFLYLIHTPPSPRNRDYTSCFQSRRSAPLPPRAITFEGTA